MSDRRQRQKEKRAAKREAERKRESRQELGRRLVTALVFGLVVVGIFVITSLFGGDDTEAPSTYDDYRSQETACGAEQPPPEQVMTFDAPEEQDDITGSTTATATVTTSCGEFVIDLNTDGAPDTVNSFVFLTREGFYDGQVIHRIAEDFVFQTGDPQADGTGGPGYVVPDEPPLEDFVYEEGVVAMWSRGALSTGSQFMVITGPDGEFLTNQFNVLGTIASGQETVDAIMDIETATASGTVERSRPLETVYVESISIEVADS